MFRRVRISLLCVLAVLAALMVPHVGASIAHANCSTNDAYSCSVAPDLEFVKFDVKPAAGDTLQAGHLALVTAFLLNNGGDMGYNHPENYDDAYQIRLPAGMTVVASADGAPLSKTPGCDTCLDGNSFFMNPGQNPMLGETEGCSSESGGSYLSCGFFKVAAGDDIRVTFYAQLPTSGTSATITGVMDPNHELPQFHQNVTFNQSFSYSAYDPQQKPDLTVTFDGPTQILPTGSAQYGVTVQNIGSGDVTGGAVTFGTSPDALPMSTQLDYGDTSTTCGTLVASTNYCFLGPLPAGTKQHFTVTVTTPTDLDKSFLLSATVAPPDHVQEVRTDNNSATIFTQVVPVVVTLSSPIHAALWYPGGVQVSMKAADASTPITYSTSASDGSWQDGPFHATGSATFTLTRDGLTDITYSVPGSSYTEPVYIDASAPTVKCSGYDGSWSARNVSVDCTAVDRGAGLRPSDDHVFTLRTNVAQGTETDSASTSTATICDLVGNCTSAGLQNVKVDLAAPSISCAQPPTDWQQANIHIACTARDNGSGLANQNDASFALSTDLGSGASSDSAQTDSRQVCDQLGHCATAGPFTGLKIDQVAPTVKCASPLTDWQATNITVSCTAGDDASGLADQSQANFSLTTSVAEGSSSASAQTDSKKVCDAAGNCVTAGPFTGLKIDRESPQVQCGSADSLWHSDNVAIGCTASDGAGSGLDSADSAFSLTTTVPANTETSSASTGSHNVCDHVGNCTAAGPIGGNMIDRKAPSISITSPTSGTQYLLNSAVPAGYSCLDGGSGLASCSGPVASGSPIDTSSVGAKTFAVTSADNVNNVATSAPVSYTVTYRICLLYDPAKVTKGNALAIKLELCDASGHNVSRANITLKALNGTSVGNSNPGGEFRFDPSVAPGGGYVFNLKTGSMNPGPGTLQFTVSGDSVQHTAAYTIG